MNGLINLYNINIIFKFSDLIEKTYSNARQSLQSLSQKSTEEDWFNC